MQPIFVVGAPRSGTTMMGAMIGSDPRIIELGEFMAFFVVGHYLRDIYSDDRSSYRTELVEHMIESAHAYAVGKATKSNCKAYVDDTPLNALVIPQLERLQSPPLYLCMVRTIPGVVKSLESSFHSGREWAGRDEAERVNLWKNFYTACNGLPASRTIFVSYEDFILRPKSNIENIRSFFRAHKISLNNMNLSVLTKNHAHGFNDNIFTLVHGCPVPSSQQKEKALSSISESPAFSKSYEHVIGQTERDIFSKVTHFSPKSRCE